MPHRFFVESASWQNNAIVFAAAQAHQIRDVLRMRVGQEVVVLDNAGKQARVALTEIGRAAVRGEILETMPAQGEPRTRITLYQALVKADKMEWVLQKGTEVGITAFIPLKTTRAIADAVSKQKYARWTQILTEAAEQAGRGKIPQLAALETLDVALQQAQPRDGGRFILWENEDALDLKRAIENTNAQDFQLLVGPEGGFTEQEITLAHDAGAQSITVGPRILRAETAGIVAATAILFARGDLSRT